MQPRDHYTTIDDFLADESFQKWVRQQEDTQDWEEWTVENPERAKLAQEARLWLLAMSVPQVDLPPADVQTALQATWAKIQRVDTEKAAPVVSLWRTNWFYRIAAVLVLGALFGWLYQRHDPNQARISYTQLVEQNPDGLLEQTNNTNKPQLITLSDGSSVLLQPTSKLSYPKNFGEKQRIVYLSGEGFFEISKNPKKPFLVFANEVVTEVIGTSFRVRAYTDQPNVEVVVRTGKVNVSSNHQLASTLHKSVLLLPNQAVRFVRQTLVFEKITDLTTDQHMASAPLGIEQLSFDFTDVPVAQILTTIEQAYSVEIDFPDEPLKNCYLTTSLSDQPLPEKLKIICESLGNNTRYEMNANKITIISAGCD